MFSALSLAVDMGTRSQNNVLASQAYQLGDPQASLHGEQQQADEKHGDEKTVPSKFHRGSPRGDRPHDALPESGC